MRRTAHLTKPAVMVFFTLFLIVQLSLPAAALFGPRPARWSWQMYSGVRTQAEFVIVRHDRTDEKVKIADYVGYPRAEIDLTRTLPAHICEVETDAAAIKIIPPGDVEATVVRCKR